jgi:type II secretory ATPase GspE/PulE/Tfp pilus assembly ATPase PilB-like protein
VKRLADFRPLPEGKEQLKLEFVERHQAVKLGQKGGTVLVGVADPEDWFLQEELKLYYQAPVEFVPVPEQDIAEYLSGLLSSAGEGAPSSAPANEKTFLDKLANDAPIVNLANTILLEGLRRGCSDIHIEAHQNQVRVRYRIDGVLQTGRTLPAAQFPSLSSRLKIMANLDIIERRQPQDGRLSVQSGQQTIEFRVSIVPLAEGESIVLRLFQKHGDVQSLADLGFGPGFLETLRRSASVSHGLVLVTGPTGSGKTTTLNALIREISKEGNKVITIEDPVENMLVGVNQIQTNETIGLGFDALLRRILRQDPDILMVGEIRDRVTADLTVRAALTGHLVLSTLHTNDSLSSVTRLADMGVEPFLIGSVVRSVVAQRLVRRLCLDCKEPAVLTAGQKDWLERMGSSIKTVYEGKGCPKCRNTGYQGRIVVAEIFPVDEACEELIVSGARHGALEKHFRDRGIPFLMDDALRLVGDGLTSLSEVEREVFTR